MNNQSKKDHIMRSRAPRNDGFNFTIGDVNRAILALFGEPVLAADDSEHQMKFIRKCQTGHTMSLKALFRLVSLYGGTITLYFDLTKRNSIPVDDVDSFFPLVERLCYNKRVSEDKHLSDSEYKSVMTKSFLETNEKKPFVRLSEFLAYKFYASNFRVEIKNRGHIDWSTNNSSCTAYVEDEHAIISYDIKENKGENSDEEPTLITKVAETPLRESDKIFLRRNEDDIFMDAEDTKKQTQTLSERLDREDKPFIVRNGGMVVSGKAKEKKSHTKHSAGIKKLIKIGFINEKLELTKDAIEAIGNDEYQISRIIL